MAKWSFINSLNGFTTIPFGTTVLPGAIGSRVVVSSLYVNGISKVPFGDISGWTVMRNPQSFAGDGNADVLWMGSGSDNVAIVWDERTTEQGVGGPFYDLYEGYPGDATGNNIRYGLPGGSIGQETASFETILGGDAHDFINLGYDARTFNYTIGGVSTPVAGRAYALDITIDVGSGRDLVIAGEGNDVIYGGDENLNIGDGLWGMGGNDIIYGGRNFSTGFGDDLYGYAGNDTLYGANSGEVYYGDSGNDVIYGAGSFAFDPGNPGLAIGAASNNVYFGGDGDDVMYAGATFALGQEDFYGGNPAAGWVDAAFVENANGADNSLNDTVNYSAWTTAGVSIDLQTAGGFGTGAGAAANDRFFGIEHLVGSNSANFGDTLIGSNVGNRLEGLAGNDTLDGEAGADTLFGGAGNDLLFSGTGADSMAGGTGTDTLTYAAATGAITISMSGGAGSGDHAAGDTVAGDIEVLIGSGFDDSLTGSAIANTILGGNGNDTIAGAAGADSLDGGAGSNWLSYAGSAAAVAVNLGTSSAAGGDAAGDTFVNFQNLIGSAGNDTLTGSAAANTIFGGDGVDTIEGGAGADSLNGGLGGDWLSYASSGAGVQVNLATSSAAGGDAAGDSIANFRNLLGSAFADNLTGDTAANSISGGNGADTVEGGVGADTMAGGAGIDWLSYAGSASAVAVNLGAGTASGGDAAGDVFSEFENLLGSAGSDTLTGSAAANTIFGGDGNDTIEGAGGADSMNGAGGIDFLSYASSNAAVVVNLETGVGSGGHATGDVFANFRHLIGSAFADTLTGDSGNNSIVGNDGADVINGGAGVDSLFGGAGDDLLAGGSGIDSLFGGVGNDRFILNAETTFAGSLAAWDGEAGSAPLSIAVPGSAVAYVDFAFGGGDIDTIDIRAQSDVSAGQSRATVYSPGTANVGGFLAGIEIIAAGAAADIINLSYNDGSTRVAYAENITVMGGAGDDIVVSGSGNDLIVGGLLTGSIGATGGADLIYGGAGNDVIFGDDQDPLSLLGGNDTLYGGLGSDTIFGGVGDDTIYGGAALDSLFGDVGNDVIFADIAANAFGGDGSDLIVANFASPADSFTITGGLDDVATDGADAVYVAGSYARIDANLGAGQDRYISSSTDSGSPQVDRVFGEIGNDLISTWYGDDLLDGGGASDALWGGAGSDTIYGGGGTDYLYGGFGDNDVLVGGAGTDYYYWSRTDGLGDQIFDDFRGTPVLPGQQADNVLVVFPDFDPTETNGDGLRTGSGVVELDHDLHDLAGGDDMVRLTDIDGAGGTMWRLTVLNGDGATNYVEFDQRDVQTILLWNNDAAGTGQVIQTYAWDPIDGRYEFVG